jgi:branched-chain amino acid aminotransferase
MECSGRFFFLDGDIMPAGSNDEIASGDAAFYEVIRTRNGVPIFFNDHMNRLREGISTRYDLQSDIAADVRRGLNTLISHDLHEEINVRVTVTFTGQDQSLCICYIPSSYPSEAMIRDGVPLILYHAERLDPGVKMLNNRLRLSVNEELARRKVYEALLVNREGQITEGSRSNIFFVTNDGIIHTAPDSMVLSGITRRYVTDIIRREGIQLVYEAVREKEAGRFRSAFITGTSPMVLAVRSVEDQAFIVSDPLIGRLREVYSTMVERSINDYLKEY